jgi:outer membrane biosynthesis protein TonB
MPKPKPAPKSKTKPAPKPAPKPRAKRGKALKEPVNLNLPSLLVAIAEEYAETNGRKLSTLVEDLLRRHLDERGIPTDVPLEDVAQRINDRLGRRTPLL